MKTCANRFSMRHDFGWQEFRHEVKFDGYCCIAHEAGNQRVADIKPAKEFALK